MINSICQPKYVRNQSTAGWSLNAIPITNGIDNAGNPVYNIYFPRPWVLVGLVTLDSPATPSYPNSDSDLVTAAIHNTNAELFQAIFLDLAFATTHDIDTTVVVNYMGPGVQATDFRGYFTNFINELITSATPEQFFNRLIQPESLVKMFCTNNSASAADLWYQRWLEFIDVLKRVIDQNLMGAPGLYQIETAGTRNAYNNWNGQVSYEQNFNA
jgi:hypothetical protein